MLPHLWGTSPSLSSLVLFGLAAFGVFVVARCVYMLFFHPLHKYPGPKIAAITDLWFSHHVSTSGRACFMMQDIHRKYGDVVRTGPNRLSFVTPQSYRDIYGHVKHGEKRFLKNKWYLQDEPRISRVRDPALHGQQRKALANAFSARALRDQETVVHQYVDLLLKQLNKFGAGGRKPVDATDAYNWLTFDIIGELAFGESFGAVAEGSNSWMKLIFSNASFDLGRRTASGFGKLLGPLYLRWTYPREVIEAAAEHKRRALEKAERRIELGDTGRIDFFGHLLKSDKMTPRDLVGNADVLLLAGSETTATALDGLTWYLLNNPACLQALTAELLDAFTSLDQITSDSTAPLPYLTAVIEEGLRLFPPAPFALPRDSPGAVIDGHYVPEDVIVGVEVFAMHMDPRNFVAPDAFRPERWLGEGLAGDDRRAFQPFSTGPRACLGVNLAYMELRIALAKLVWSYEMEMACDIDSWNEACKNYLLWKKPQMLVKYHPRRPLVAAQ